MVKDLNTNNAPFSLTVGIQTSSPQLIQFCALDKNKKNAWYENIQGMVNGYREFYLSFPIAPKTLRLAIFNAGGQNPFQNEGFKIVKADIGPVKTKPIALGAQDREYLKFLYDFAKNKGEYSANTVLNSKIVPSIYGSTGGNFKFLYYNTLIDPATKKEINTPTMVGNDTGDVSWSKTKILPYTIPEVVALGLHEYGHKYKNPGTGLAIGDEFGADINGLNIFRSVGFTRYPFERVFADVFAGANTPQNQQRMVVMKKFNDDFDSGKLDKYYTDFPTTKKWAA